MSIVIWVSNREMYKYLKHTIDFFSALIAFLLLSPIFIIVMLLLSISNSGRPFFFQLRPGKNEKIFRIIKFKTMNDRKDANGDLLPDHKRLTRLGKLIRSSSLDEIPQLLNVLKGDMSIIGPRPLLPEYLPLYDELQSRRHEVRPGITGWAQVNGRNAIGWQRKFEYDVYYVDHMSFCLDLKILLHTVKKVLNRENVNFQDPTVSTHFRGNALED